MLQFERIDVSEGIGINKSNESKECMICHYWEFLDIAYKFQCNSIEPYVCNGRHDLSMMVYDLDGFMILNIEGVDYRCFVCNMSKNTAIILLNNSLLDTTPTNKTLVEIIKEGEFGGTFFRDIYSGINSK